MTIMQRPRVRNYTISWQAGKDITLLQTGLTQIVKASRKIGPKIFATFKARLVVGQKF